MLKCSAIKWYLPHGLELTMVDHLVEHESDKLLSWFPEALTNGRPEADKDHLKEQLGDVAKLKRNSFYGKMIEHLGRNKTTKPLGPRFLKI